MTIRKRIVILERLQLVKKENTAMTFEVVWANGQTVGFLESKATIKSK